MSKVNPAKVLQQVSDAIPENCRENIIIIGSLAASAAYSSDAGEMAVQTKDIHCLIRPYAMAAEKGQTIATQLMSAGWTRRMLGEYVQPGNAHTPVNQLPAMRLYPPEMGPDSPDSWFVELLTEPDSPDRSGRLWYRMIVGDEHYGLPSFRFLSLVAQAPVHIDNLGIFRARPEMMALANLLEHPEIKPDPMNSKIEGREIKRSNKDLGRVLAIAFLAQENGTVDFRPWGREWALTLKSLFKEEWKQLAARTGNGLRILLQNPDDLEQAHHTCRYGILSSYPVSESDLREVGERLLGDAIAMLEDTKTASG